MSRHIELRYLDDDVVAKARLLETDMPRTCAELLKHLPLAGTALHARYSGSEVAMAIPKHIRVAREKATCATMTGDVAYAWLNQDDHYGLDDDLAEVSVFYDRDCCPSMAEGPVRVNIFARIEGDAEAFYRARADTRITGAKRLRVSLLPEQA